MRHRHGFLAAAMACGLGAALTSTVTGALPASAATIDPFLQQQQTEQSLNRAVVLLTQGRVDEAEEVVRAFLRFDPKSPKAYEVLGAVLGRKGDQAGALAAMDKALELDPNQPTVLINRGMLLSLEGRTDEAIRDLEEAVAVAPEFLPARERLGRVYEQAGRYPDAIAQYEIAVRAPAGKEPGARLNLANLYNAAGQGAQAVALLEPWVADREVEPVVHRVLGDAYLSSGRPEEAERQYQMALEAAPDDFRARLGRGMALRLQGQNARAMEVFRNLAAEQPDSADPVAQIGETQIAMGEVDEGVASLRKAAEMAEQPADIESRLVAVLSENGRADEAVALLEAKLERDGLQPQTLAALAVAQQAAGDEAAALRTLERATKSFPEDAGGHARLAIFEREQGDFAAALASAEAGLEQAPDNLLLLRLAAATARDAQEMDKAVLYGERLLEADGATERDRLAYATYLDQAGQYGPAIEQYRAVIEAQADNWPALNNLALALTRSGKAQEGLTFARRASRLQPDNPAVMHTLGYVLFQTGDLDEAEPLIAKAAEALPEEAEIAFDHGQLLARMGDKAAAKAELERGLALDPDAPKAAEARETLKSL